MNISSIIKNNFPEITDADLIAEIEKFGKIKSLKENEILMDYGQVIHFIPLIFEGSLKVFKENEKGAELFLYYIQAGQGCAVSFACFDKMSSLRVEAFEDSKIIAIPISKMEEWVGKYPNWNKFVLTIYNQRFDELLESLNEVAFNKLDERLEDYLEKQSEIYDSNQLKITHAKIATELNTSREVVSRLLKKMEQEKIVQLKRNEIILL